LRHSSVRRCRNSHLGAAACAANRKTLFMQKATIKRHAFRTLLVIHFVGLALSLGARLADYVIEQQTSHGTLQALAFGRDLTGGVARTLIVPGFLSLFLSGVALTLLRYGRRAPLWVWIKVALNLIAVVGIAPFVAPAVAGARQWAHWSADHDQLAPQFQQNAAQAAFYGAIVVTLFLLNIPVAVWKPRLSVKAPQAARSGGLAEPTSTSSTQNRNQPGNRLIGTSRSQTFKQ
jgi:hypothetical protein